MPQNTKRHGLPRRYAPRNDIFNLWLIVNKKVIALKIVALKIVALKI